VLLIVLAAVVVFVVVPLVLALALGRARGRTRSHDPQAAVLAELAEVRSPSGTPFFASGDQALELAEQIDELRRPQAPRKG
jgi:hypothetical protein